METTQIRSGPPAVHQLRTKKETFGTLSRVTVGEKDQNKPNKIILLVGETGAGKSTLINALFNYSIGVKFEDDVWFQIVEDEGQTSDVMVYQMFGGKTLPFSLTIIDTPGFGDTRGIEHDVLVSQRLFDLFRSEDGVHEVHAVGLVMKANDNQPSDHLNYITDLVTSLFGKKLWERLVALITHSEGRTPEDVLQPVHFLFNNCQNEERTEETRMGLEDGWRVTNKGMEEFTEFLQRRSSHQLEATSGLNTSIQLTACIQNLQERIKLTEMTQAEIKQVQEALEKHQEEMEKNNKFTIEVDEVYKDKEPADGGMWFLKEAVCCTICEENCHHPGCTMAQDPEHCEVMQYGRCTVCTGKCPASAHVKENWRYVTNTRKVQRTNEENKRTYKKKERNNKEATLSEMLAEEIESLNSQKSKLVDESYQHVLKLKQKVLKFNSLSTYVSLDFLIEKMKEKGDAKKLQKLEKINSQTDEGAKALAPRSPSEKPEKINCQTDEGTKALAPRSPSEKPEKINCQTDEGAKALAPRSPSENPEKINCQTDEGDDPLLQSKPNNTAPQQSTFNSTQIRSGPPAVHQLRTKKETFGTLSRVTVGEKDQNKPNKIILLVGETGAGKSTLINALFNYSIGVKFEDDVWYQIVEDEKKSQAESQTSDVIVYQIFGFEGKTLPFSLTIIDTPGFGDTRGIELDVIVSQRLFDLFRSEDGVHEVHAVGLVMKASVNRLSDRLMYIFDSVMSLFGKDVENNIVALVTHSNGRTPKDPLQALESAKIKCARDEKSRPVYFLFNNCQDEDRTEEAEMLEIADKVATRGLTAFTAFLEKTASQELQTTVEVLNERIRLTACVQNLQERIQLIELKQTEIKQIQEGLKECEEEMKQKKKVTIEVDEVCKDREDIDDGMWLMTLIKAAVCCTVCEENCHYPGCTTARSPKDCEVMSDGRCTVCTNKCPVSAHVKGKWRYVTKTRKVQKTVTDINKRRDKNHSARDKKVSLLENLEKEMKHLTAEKLQLLDESFQHVVNLEQIALNVTSVSTYVHFDFLIEKMKEMGEKQKVQKLEEIKRREDEGTCSKLLYVCHKLTNSG